MSVQQSPYRPTAKIADMFDAICKYLVETFSADFASWLLGEAVSFEEV